MKKGKDLKGDCMQEEEKCVVKSLNKEMTVCVPKGLNCPIRDLVILGSTTNPDPLQYDPAYITLPGNLYLFFSRTNDNYPLSESKIT